MQENEQITFVLAGASGSGKSTLLQKAFRKKIPIFGDEMNGLFQAVNPMALPEKHNFQKALKEKAVFQAKHIPKLQALENQPQHLVLHLDILNVLVRLINHPFFMDEMPVGLKVLQPREPEDLIDKETNKLMFRYYLNKSFEGAGRVLINTLCTPYQKNVEQWQMKALRNPDLDQEHPLFDINNPCPEIHQAIYDAWTEMVEELDCHRIYVSVVEGEVLELTQRKPDLGTSQKFSLSE
ncbi:MAG: hypothetical protein ACO1NO_09280 [Burkholderiaceae bacterium]